MRATKRKLLHRYGNDALVGLTLSVVTLSLGAAFGQLSGRGILLGMLSAAVIPLITSLLGGTRVQCSGPTGPMTAAFIVVLAGSSHMPDGTVNLILFLTGVLLAIAALLRVGHWIRAVPNIAVSGFMNGVAIIIWLSQGEQLLTMQSINLLVALLTIGIAVGISSLNRLLLPGTLVAIVTMTVFVHLADLPVEFAVAGLSLHSLQDVSMLFAQNAPAAWPWHLTISALPLALQLTGVAIMDTLLTSLVIDRMRKEHSGRNRELTAQGIAMGSVALFGGVPGAQATERSVLMVREGAYGRFAGIATGLFALAFIFLLQDAISLIPKAVFAGVLLKIGYDVFDWLPLRLWLRRNTHVSTLEICIILATAIVTAAVDVTVAIVGCTLAYYALRRLPSLRPYLSDLVPVKETEGVVDEP